MSSCWATRRASSTSAIEQQPVSLAPPHSRIVSPTTSWPACSSSSAATDESTPPLIAQSTFIGCVALRRPPRRVARSMSAAVVVRPSVRRSAPSAHSRSTPIAASTCDGSIAPAAHADAALAHTPPSSSRYSNASFSMPRMHTCADPATLSSGGTVSRTSAQLAAQLTHEPVAQLGEARVLVVALGIGEPQRLGERDGAGDVLRAAASLALLSATDEQRFERHPARGTPARRCPSAHRTCAPTATSGRRAG